MKGSQQIGRRAERKVELNKNNNKMSFSYIFRYLLVCYLKKLKITTGVPKCVNIVMGSDARITLAKFDQM